MISYNDYVKITDDVSMYPAYVGHGLREEYGEVRGVFKRHLRDDGGGAFWSEERKQQLKSELGDLLWYAVRGLRHHNDYACVDEAWWVTYPVICVNFIKDDFWWNCFDEAIYRDLHLSVIEMIRGLAGQFSWSLSDVAHCNAEKLLDRKKRGVLHGKGGDR